MTRRVENPIVSDKTLSAAFENILICIIVIEGLRLLLSDGVLELISAVSFFGFLGWILRSVWLCLSFLAVRNPDKAASPNKVSEDHPSVVVFIYSLLMVYCKNTNEIVEVVSACYLFAQALIITSLVIVLALIMDPYLQEDKYYGFMTSDHEKLAINIIVVIGLYANHIDIEKMENLWSSLLSILEAHDQQK